MATDRPPTRVRRVLLVSSEPRWRGGERQAQLLASGLRARGVEARFLAPRATEVTDRLRADGFRVDDLHGRGAAAILTTRRLVRRFAPQIVHANDAGALPPAALAAWRRTGTAVVASRRVAFRLRRVSLYRHLVDGLICVSAPVAEMAHAAGLAAKVTIVPDGLDLQAIDAGDRLRGRAGLQLDATTPLILCVAALDGAKGQDILLRAFAGLRPSTPAPLLALAGVGAQRPVLERLAGRLGIAERVRFLGFRDDVPDLLAAADLFVSASSSEGLGSATLEAMAAGLPVIGTDVGGAGELLAPDAHGEVAWRVPSADPEALAAALAAALDDRHAARERARRGRDRARPYTAARLVGATLEVYERLMER